MAQFLDIAAVLGRDSHVAMILADASGHIRFWNDGAAAIFGHSADDALGQRVDLVVPPQYRDMHWAGFNRTMHTAWTGHDGFSSIEGLHSSGAIIALEVMLTPLRDADGRTEAVFCSVGHPTKACRPASNGCSSARRSRR
jgi:PAS domain S-box-containing protein